ncbi:MAG: CopD family protein [Saprospiraceae bacterium]
MCTPGMIVSWLSGIWLIFLNGMSWLQQSEWMLQKVLLLVLLTVFHLMTNWEIKKLSLQMHHMTTAQFKLYNVIPVLFLLAIVIISIFKNDHTVVNPMVVIGLASALLYIFARIKNPKFFHIKNKTNDTD